jgi:hypothetical protein
MPFPGILCHIVLFGTDVSEEHIASIIKMKRTIQQGTLAVTSNLKTLSTFRGVFNCEL